MLPSDLVIQGTVSDHSLVPLDIGSFGYVYLVNFKGAKVAIKVVRPTRPGSEEPSTIAKVF